MTTPSILTKKSFPSSSDRPQSSYVHMRRLFVRNQKLDAFIGIYDYEKTKPQPIFVSVDATVKYTSDHIDDNCAHVLNYERITEIVRNVVNAGHINLVETLADRIALSCLENQMVLIARVEVIKPEAIDAVDGVGIVVEHRRTGQ